MSESVRYWTLSIGGMLLLTATVFLALQWVWWLAILGPLVLLWSVWMLREYWKWVRSLGK